MTMVLHTHNRRRDFHPHIHVIVPGGGVDKRRRQWKKIKGKYLFNEFAMAKVFRARFLTALNEAGLSIPKNVPPKWVVDCKHVGKGITALKYLSKYLYRGVISEKNIVSNQNGQVTFKYIESKTGNTLYRTLKGEDFLHLIMQHVLPKGFRRVRDYGFLHGNAKKLLFLIQLILHVVIKGIELRPRPVFKCPLCKTPMVVLGFRQAIWGSG
ncbi:MAG: transposase [Desulfobacula sp.]|nr:transposase [Desulfobacula sp.]